MTAPHPNRFTPAHPEDHQILDLWRANKNTAEIAQTLWVPEHHIAVRLPEILQRARQDQEWIQLRA